MLIHIFILVFQYQNNGPVFEINMYYYCYILIKSHSTYICIICLGLLFLRSVSIRHYLYIVLYILYLYIIGSAFSRTAFCFFLSWMYFRYCNFTDKIVTNTIPKRSRINILLRVQFSLCYYLTQLIEHKSLLI